MRYWNCLGFCKCMPDFNVHHCIVYPDDPSFLDSHKGTKENHFPVDICFSLILSFSRAIISSVLQLLCNANVVKGSWI